MTGTTWRSICHARAVTPITLSLVRQSMDFGRTTRIGAFCETKRMNGKNDISRIGRVFLIRKLENREIFVFVNLEKLQTF